IRVAGRLRPACHGTRWRPQYHCGRQSHGRRVGTPSRIGSVRSWAILTGPTMTAPVPVIQLDNLSKQYGHVPALRSVSLEVRPGEIFGFLGLNGAGKTTAIRILLDLVRPTSGQAFILGVDCRTQGLTARAQIGYL